MSDVTFGVKVNKDLKDKISALMKDSGLQGKDFMTNLINLYELENVKSASPKIAEDIKELQCLTNRMNTIYMNIATRIENLYKSESENFKNKLDKKENEIKKIKESIQDIKNKYENKNSDYKNLENEYKNTIASLEECKQINQNSNMLIKEYTEKINNQNITIEKLGKFSIQIDSLKENLHICEKDNTFYKNKIKDLELNFKTQLQEKDSKIELLKNNITSLNNKYKEEISYMNERHELEKEKLKLQCEKQHQKNLNSTVDEYNGKIKNLLDDLQSKNKKLKNFEETSN